MTVADVVVGGGVLVLVVPVATPHLHDGEGARRAGPARVGVIERRGEREGGALGAGLLADSWGHSPVHVGAVIDELGELVDANSFIVSYGMTTSAARCAPDLGAMHSRAPHPVPLQTCPQPTRSAPVAGGAAVFNGIVGSGSLGMTGITAALSAGAPSGVAPGW